MDIDYNELFGIGEQEQEVAAPAEQPKESTEPDVPEPSGENEREAAEPAEDTEAAAPEADAEEGQADAEGEGAKTQSRAERAKHAAARRKAELEAAVAKAREEERAAAEERMKKLLADAELRNPFKDNAPIQSIEEFNEYKKQAGAAQIQRNLRAGRLTPEDIEKIVAETPVVKKAAELIEQSERARDEARINEQLKEIGKLDPGVKTVDDLVKMDSAKEFYGYVKKGYSFVDAFKLANFEKLRTDAQAAAQQQALNRSRSKDHLSSTATRGAGAVAVPADVMAYYRVLDPDMSDSEIQAHYNKCLTK